jgi:GNAT superfamily N-acetyltransferase
VITVNNPSDKEVVSILSDAFHDDPVLKWIKDSADFVPFFMELMLPAFIPMGLTYVDHERCGAASWIGPKDQLHWPFTLTNLLKMARTGGPSALYRMAVSGWKTEKSHPREPHYYLFMIGARPDCQGQGVGSALISHMLRRCDREQMPVYLENSKEANLDFYRGHGFQVQQEIRFAKSAPPLWLMWREPFAPAPAT